MLLTGGGEELTGAILTPYNAQARLIRELIKVSKISKKASTDLSQLTSSYFDICVLDIPQTVFPETAGEFEAR